MEFFQFKPSSTVTIGPPGGTGKPHHGHHGHHGGPEHHLPFPHGPWVSLISLIGDARSGNSQLTISPNPRLDSSTLPTPDTLPFGSSSPSSPSVSSVSLFSLLGSRGRLGSSTGTYSRSHAGRLDTSINAKLAGFPPWSSPVPWSLTLPWPLDSVSLISLPRSQVPTPRTSTSSDRSTMHVRP
jgi:hypothetical protein